MTKPLMNCKVGFSVTRQREWHFGALMGGQSIRDGHQRRRERGVPAPKHEDSEPHRRSCPFNGAGGPNRRCRRGADVTDTFYGSVPTSRGGSLFGGFLGGLEWGVSMVAGAALGAWLGLRWGHRTMGSK